MPNYRPYKWVEGHQKLKLKVIKSFDDFQIELLTTLTFSVWWPSTHFSTHYSYSMDHFIVK